MRQRLIPGIFLMGLAQIPADHNGDILPERQTCPVCGMENISCEADRCPQCDADMTCFKVLDTLPDEIKPQTSGHETKPSPAPVETVQNSRFSTVRNLMPILMLLLTGLIILLTLFQFYRFKKLETLVANQKTELTKSLQGLMEEAKKTGGTEDPLLSSEIRQKADSGIKSAAPPENVQPESDKAKAETSQPETPKERLPRPKPEPPPESEFRIYEAGDGDTLWDIAEMYYGSGHYYPVLLEHNPNICIFEIGDGVRLKILKNPRLARQIYGQIIVKEKDHLYWYYTIVEGDTFRSVVNKFYRIKDVERHLSGIRPDDELQAGKRIRILLQ